MRSFMITTLSLLILYSSQLFAHPHEVAGIGHHGLFQGLTGGGLSLICAILMGLIVFKAVASFHGTGSSNK